MPLSLPNLTLVAIDTKEHSLTLVALLDTLQQITPGKILFFSDRPIYLPVPYDFISCNPTSYDAVAKLLWWEVADRVKTSHVLTIQYDGWVLNGDLWRDEWLSYDYIGAPWPWYGTHNVGNGGFSLRSRRLLSFLVNNPQRFPPHHPEDRSLCREYRFALEREGFKWAPVQVAAAFSFERTAPYSAFGFHGLFNFPHILSPEVYKERLALATPFARSKVEWKELAHV